MTRQVDRWKRVSGASSSAAEAVVFIDRLTASPAFGALFRQGMALVESVEQAQAIEVPDPDRVGVITQTTLSLDDTRFVIAAVHRRFSDVQGPATRDICYATQRRQAAVRELAQAVDVLVVVGARNSSNSNRLREIGEQAGLPSYLVADGSEVDPEWFRGVETVGVTAGASAPEALVEDVVRALKRIAPSDVSLQDGPTESVTFRLPAELAL